MARMTIVTVAIVGLLLTFTTGQAAEPGKRAKKRSTVSTAALLKSLDKELGALQKIQQRLSAAHARSLGRQIKRLRSLHQKLVRATRKPGRKKKPGKKKPRKKKPGKKKPGKKKPSKKKPMKRK